jgi:hypothetical protein
MDSAPTRLDRDPWAPLRALQECFSAAQNHSHYAARGNEQPLLQDLIDGDPPEGGITAYVADMSKE